MLGMKGMWPLVRINLPFPRIFLLLAHTYKVDIELGLQPVQSTPTSLEAPEHEEAVVPSVLPAEHAGSVAEPEHMSVPKQSTEPQSTPATTVDTETSLGPSSAQGAPVEDNDLPNVDCGNAQPAIPNLEHGELVTVAIDNHHQAGVH